VAEPTICKGAHAISHEEASYQGTDTEENTEAREYLESRDRRDREGANSMRQVTLFVKLPIVRFLASGRSHIKNF